ncbi:MAG: hypothetical protein M0Q44_16375 [Methylobacter sp.]|jgi:hypothetical protein|nr:hypothetical protein [Methylobacter sp.]
MKHTVEVHLTKDDIEIIEQLKQSNSKNVHTNEEALLWALRKMHQETKESSFEFVKRIIGEAEQGKKTILEPEPAPKADENIPNIISNTGKFSGGNSGGGMGSGGLGR